MQILKLLMILFLVACVPKPGKDGLLGDFNQEQDQNQTETPPAVNIAPQVSLGSDISITLPTNAINIQASAIDQDGNISAYAWEKISGANATLIGAQSDLLQLSNLQEGTYQFRLTVTDNVGASASDEIQVMVKPAPAVAVNQAPNVNAGVDQEITLPTNSATFSASAQDNDGTIASYSWSKISGPSATLSGVNTLNLSASNLLQGTYVFRVTVTDNQNAQASDDVQIIVNPKPNAAPSIAAIADIKLNLPTNSTNITAVATDSDGTIASYSWSKKAGGAATLSNSNSATLSVTALASGSYEFEIAVIDNNGLSAKAIAKVFVNAQPTINAGSDKEITLPTNTLSLSASASDSDGSIASYLWEKNSGPAATLTNATTSNLSLSNLVEGTYVFKVTVVDNLNAQASDEVQVVVKPKPNTAPVANAGNNQTIQLPTNSVTLSGSASDVDNQALTYLWTKKSGASATIATSTNLNTNVSGLVEGTYIFNLKVTDTLGASHDDDVQVVVQAATSNEKPTLTMFHQVCSPNCLNYWVSLPKDYYTSSGPFPVIMFLHGFGERGDGSDTTTNRDKIALHGPFKYIKNGTWPQNYKFIVIAPQLPTSTSGFDWTDSSKAADFQNWTEKVINHATATFTKSDSTRLYVTGLSMGGEGSTRLMVRYPSRYAAAVVASGRYDLNLDACVAKDKGMWFFHGDLDNGVDNNYNQGLAAVNKFNNCHSSSSSHMAGMTTLVGDGHTTSAWNKVYGSFGTQHSGTNIYDWLLQNTTSIKVKPPVIATAEPPAVIVGGIEANTPPTISKIPNVFMDEGSTKFIKIDYQDDDDDQVVINFIQSLPSFASIEDDINGTLTLRVEPNADGGFNKRFDVEAKDQTAKASTAFNIRVRNPSIKYSDATMASLAGKQTARPLNSTAAKYGFYEYVPQNVANTSHALYKKWPVILFLHGMGERSENGAKGLNVVLYHGPGKLIAGGKHFDAFVFTPQANYSWDSNALDEFVDHIFSVYGDHIDRTRLYVTGLSMGGGGTMSYAGFRPDRVAAIVPICGVSTDLGFELTNTPIWAFTNKDDGTVGRGSTEGVLKDANDYGSGSLWSQWPYGGGGPSNATSMPFATTAVNARTISGTTGWANSWLWTEGFINNNVGIHKYTIYNASGHDSWTKTYNDSVNSQKIGVYDWMFAQKLIEHDIRITQIRFSQIQHHQNESPQVRFEVKVTGKNPIAGVFAQLNNFGGSSKYNLKMTSIGDNRYELLYNMPSNLGLGKRDISFLAIDNQKNAKVEKRQYAILNPVYTNSVASNELNYKVKINFGDASIAANTWNTTMFGPTPGMVYPSLLTEDLRNSKITMLAGSGWSGAGNWSGFDVGSSTTHDYKQAITRSSWDVYKGIGKLYFHGLNKNQKYSFKFFASNKDATDRFCYFKINSTEVMLQAKQNAVNTVNIDNVTPDANGMVEVQVRNHSNSGDWSQSTYHYAHINAIEISPTN